MKIIIFRLKFDNLIFVLFFSITNCKYSLKYVYVQFFFFLIKLKIGKKSNLISGTPRGHITSD